MLPFESKLGETHHLFREKDVEKNGHDPLNVLWAAEYAKRNQCLKKAVENDGDGEVDWDVAPCGVVDGGSGDVSPGKEGCFTVGCFISELGIRWISVGCSLGIRWISVEFLV